MDKEIEALVEERKEAYEKYASTKKEEDTTTYLETKWTTGRSMRTENKEIWDGNYQEINTYLGRRQFFGVMETCRKDQVKWEKEHNCTARIYNKMKHHYGNYSVKNTIYIYNLVIFCFKVAHFFQLFYMQQVFNGSTAKKNNIRWCHCNVTNI